MSDITIRVAASSDDCVRNTVGTDFWSITDIGTYAGYLSTDYKNLGSAFRFLNVTIPAGMLIISAKLIQKASAAYTLGDVNTRLRAEKNINPATFSTKEDFDARTWTDAYVNWDAIPPWAVVGGEYVSVDIKTCIQEVIDLPGWASGNPIVILWDDFEQRSTQTDNTYRRGCSKDHTVYSAPDLYIEYEEAPTGVAGLNPALMELLDY